jgi:hypothetical protein
VFRPGWIGIILVGAVSAIVVWGAYGGPGSTVAIFANSNDPLDLRTGQVIISIVIGIGGGKILTSLADQLGEKVTRKDLAVSLQNVLKRERADS